MEIARFSSRMFHHLPLPLAKVCNMLFDYTPILGMMVKENYLRRAEEETMILKGLHVI
ncbi:hypothetical protein BDW71DRAFT_190775 [Aspergillus fruticulosus]